MSMRGTITSRATVVVHLQDTGDHLLLALVDRGAFLVNLHETAQPIFAEEDRVVAFLGVLAAQAFACPCRA